MAAAQHQADAEGRDEGAEAEEEVETSIHGEIMEKLGKSWKDHGDFMEKLEKIMEKTQEILVNQEKTIAIEAMAIDIVRIFPRKKVIFNGYAVKLLEVN